MKPATQAGIREDLEILRPYFDGLITYSATNGIEGVAEVASKLNFRALIIGIWDPSSELELNNLLRAYQKHPNLIIAVIVGNEGLFAKRYTANDVQLAVKRIKRAAPSLAATTSEPFSMYFTPEHVDFFRSHDLLMPNVHPVFEKWFSPNALEQGITMVIDVTAKLKTTYRLPILIKETGLPSGETAQGFTPARQAQFWKELRKRLQISTTQSFAYFEAFDTPWKPAQMASEFPGDHANEAYWGLFTTTGQAKEVVNSLTRTPPKFPHPVPH